MAVTANFMGLSTPYYVSDMVLIVLHYFSFNNDQQTMREYNYFSYFLYCGTKWNIKKVPLVSASEYQSPS